MCCRTNTLTFCYRTGCCCCENLMELSLYRQIFEKNSMDRQTDRQTYMHEILALLRKRIKFATLIGAQNVEKFYTLTSLTK